MLVRPNPRRVAGRRTIRLLTAAVACLLLTLPAVAAPRTAGSAPSGRLAADLPARPAGADPGRVESHVGARPAETPAPPATATKPATKRAVTPAGKKAAKTPAKKPAKKSAKKPAKKPAKKSSAKPKKAVAPAPKRAVSPSHYIRSLNGNARHDAAIMRALGARDAARNAAGMQHLVLLDIGGQVGGGVHLSTTHKFVSYGALNNAVAAFIDGYHSRQQRNAPVLIAVGTNNDLAVGWSAGRDWATRLINPLSKHASRYHGITVAGADDIEPGFAGGVSATRDWMRAYLRYTNQQLVFNGSADGCSWLQVWSVCHGGWTTGDLAVVAGLMAPSRILVLPQIYNHAMAVQWTMIQRYAVHNHHTSLRIVGVLTENAACGADPECPTMPSHPAAQQLWTLLAHAHVSPNAVPLEVDLDVR